MSHHFIFTGQGLRDVNSQAGTSLYRLWISQDAAVLPSTVITKMRVKGSRTNDNYYAARSAKRQKGDRKQSSPWRDGHHILPTQDRESDRFQRKQLVRLFRSMRVSMSTWYITPTEHAPTTLYATRICEAKRERYFDKVSATSIRTTAEVTICIISKRLLDRPRQLPHA